MVDDEPAVRRAVERALHLEGYEVGLAADGADALEQLAATPADALVLDVMMPRVDGLEVCQRLRSTGDGVPILLLTARDAVSDRVTGLDAGADDYLVKPFALEELLARIRALLRRGGQERGEELRFADTVLDRSSRAGPAPLDLAAIRCVTRRHASDQAHAHDQVPTEGDHPGRREIDAGVHDHEHLPERRVVVDQLGNCGHIVRLGFPLEDEALEGFVLEWIPQHGDMKARHELNAVHLRRSLGSLRTE